MAQQIQDDGFHEIQLNGKQLVFLFMAATVVSVVIFLCGVLVGRGVRAQLSGGADQRRCASVGRGNDADAASRTGAGARRRLGSDDGRRAADAAAEELSYFNRLEKANAPAEQLKPAPDRRPRRRSTRPRHRRPRVAAAPRPAPPPPAPVKEPAPRARAGGSASRRRPSRQGRASRCRLPRSTCAAKPTRSPSGSSSKGYAAYVLTPANGTPSVFRVRVGKFKTRREAETIAAKLQKEEQFKPWVTR